MAFSKSWKTIHWALLFSGPWKKLRRKNFWQKSDEEICEEVNERFEKLKLISNDELEPKLKCLDKESKNAATELHRKQFISNIIYELEHHGFTRNGVADLNQIPKIWPQSQFTI